MSQHLSGMEQAGAVDGKNNLPRDGHTSKVAEQRKDSKVLKGGAVPARVRSACGSAESQCVASAGITRCVRSTNGGGIRAGSPFAPVASRGRAGS